MNLGFAYIMAKNGSDWGHVGHGNCAALLCYGAAAWVYEVGGSWLQGLGFRVENTVLPMLIFTKC